MNKICTSIEESKKLIELGIDRSTSDMFYYCGEDLRIGGYKAQDDDFDIPAWSLTALLEMLPEDFLLMDNQGETKPILYSVWTSAFGAKPHFWRHNLVDAVFEMICWLKENNNNESDLKQKRMTYERLYRFRQYKTKS